MTTAEAINKTFYRISRGLPQAEVKVYRPAIQSILGQALQRLADKIAADPVSYTILYRETDLTLVGGEVSLASLSPTLLLSKEARKHWRVTMTGVTNPIQPLPNRHDLDNPPITPDYYFYTVFASKLLIRKYDKSIPSETAVQLFGNIVPLINDASLSSTGELSDDFIDITVALTLESMNPAEIAKQAEGTDATAQPTT